MSKITQRILVILVATLTIFSILSFCKLKEIWQYSIMAEGWLSDMDIKLDHIKYDVSNIDVLGGGSTSFPTSVTNRIDEIADSVYNMNKTLSGINSWRIDFTTLYLNANKNALNGYLNSISK